MAGMAGGALAFVGISAAYVGTISSQNEEAFTVKEIRANRFVLLDDQKNKLMSLSRTEKLSTTTAEKILIDLPSGEIGISTEPDFYLDMRAKTNKDQRYTVLRPGGAVFYGLFADILLKSSVPEPENLVTKKGRAIHLLVNDLEAKVKVEAWSPDKQSEIKVLDVYSPD